ncbi:MAG: phosphotransferase, partial [Planctomycetes bacterium]|nr:phosphotransferase [Planctomycetota bacterium]
QLKAKTWPMRLGVVHGDLHPGNIILRTGEPPAIIDFGWSKDLAHVAKDYVLMECNIRFLTLRPQVGESQLEPFVKWVAWDEKAPGTLIKYLQQRAQLVECVREQATTALGADTNWNQEYLVPLFLTAFGLLRYAPQLGHQSAAVLFVESLARHLADVLKL